jgi:hypothetical protein
MVFLFELIGLWVLASCILGPLVTWSFFRQRRIERGIEDTLSGLPKTATPGAQHLSVVA